MKWKKTVVVLMAAALAIGVFAGCGRNGRGDADGASGMITVNTREDGSGTRSAFVELFGVEEDVDGEMYDMITVEAKVTNSTSVMMNTVAWDVNSIGYISLGSLDDTVTAVKIDGVEPTAENVANGTYKISRPFNVATGEDLSEAASDFMSYIMSADGQQVVEDEGYIKAAPDAAEYVNTGVKGSVTVAGSSSVTPVMEKLKEAYEEVNPRVKVEIQESDSTTGMQNVMEGVCDIGMASRELKDSEISAGLTATVIARDGIVVIVNNDSGITDLTTDQVRQIYLGELTEWEDLR